MIKDAGIIGRIRAYVTTGHADWEEVQEGLLNSWKGDIENSYVLLYADRDATCFISHVRFPTDVKLLSESR
ncbi:MAG: hypothetical protein WD431_02725 [Cyclobacteriaceae bacterium]